MSETAITGKIGTFPGEIKTVSLKPGTPVTEALEQAGVSFGQGQTLKFNSVKFTDAAALSGVEIEDDNFTITITGKVSGN